MNEKTIYLPVNPGIRADLRYTGKKKFDTNESRRRKRYRQSKTGSRNSHDEKCKQIKYSDRFSENRSSSDDDRGDRSDRDKSKSIARKQRSVDGSLDEVEILVRMAFLETRPSHYCSVGSNQGVVVISTWNLTSVAKDDDGASSGLYVR